jgi:hypothetical protein
MDNLESKQVEGSYMGASQTDQNNSKNKIVTHHEAKTAPWWPSEDIPMVPVFLARHIFSLFNQRYVLRVLIIVLTTVIGDGAHVLFGQQ